MLKTMMKTGLAILLLGILQSGFAQYAAEMFIPLGESPGLSGKHTTLGNVKSVNTQNKIISISGSSGNFDLRINDKTQVWLDQSKLRLNNKKVSIDEIKKGMLAEVKYVKNEKGGAVEWIKVQLVD